MGKTPPGTAENSAHHLSAAGGMGSTRCVFPHHHIKALLKQDLLKIQDLWENTDHRNPHAQPLCINNALQSPSGELCRLDLPALRKRMFGQ